ncbi:hypothetical protein [Fibrella forsythiae]|uniref:Uncharacterized protein n=1 Tax=Fibrella forsythiae TaxID=2817061 RepID=A0ABS3JC38_9BACT|nr:hypothetical protein [Fibrella forsythiae]MBO0947569.1 hypothetical protein [Fibrella forsythiae]
MSDSNYKKYGLHKNVPVDDAKKLTNQFYKAKDRRAKLGLFLGVDFLDDLVKELKKESFDGILIKYGISKASGGSPSTYELVGLPIELAGAASLNTARTAATYYSSKPVDGATNPPDVGSPPLSSEVTTVE